MSRVIGPVLIAVSLFSTGLLAGLGVANIADSPEQRPAEVVTVQFGTRLAGVQQCFIAMTEQGAVPLGCERVE